MRGSHIFVMYTSADGQNVTVSPRLGTGYSEPQHTSTTDLELLEGSGVRNGIMTANVRCGNCNSWDTGTMDFSSASNTDWIYGYHTGDSLNSDDVSESINRHDQAAPFQWDLASAQGGENVNPFVTSTAATASDSGTTSGNATSSGVSSSSSGGSGVNADTVQLAHGAMASLAFVAIFPTGGILVRVASFTGLIWIHAALQILGYVIYIAAFGMGIWLATTDNYMSDKHPIIGIVLFVLLFTQPLGGFLHHHLYKKNGHRTIISHLHVNIGRIIIVLGIINGGLGLELAGVEDKYKIVYGVFAGLMGIAYIAAIIFGEVKRSRKTHTELSSFEKNEGRSQQGVAKDRPSSQRELGSK